ncbi:MAG: ADP-ribosylation factor-like protein, partial [Promethearchaeota archaeon]
MYDANFKIVLFGDDTEAKRTLTNNYMISLFSSSQADSLGVDFEVKSLSVDDFKIKLQVWDISGERRFRDMLPNYISHARGGLFVYDVAEKSSLTNIDFWLSLVKKELTKEELFPIIAVGIVPESINQRQITSEDSKILADLHELNGFVECDVKSERDIEKMFESLSRLILERSPPPSVPLDSLSLRKKKGNELSVK